MLLCARTDPPAAIGAASEIVERTNGRTLALSGLTVEEVVDLLGPHGRHLASSYHDETAGNPLACLLLEESGWEPGEVAPPTVATLVAARMARLDQRAPPVRGGRRPHRLGVRCRTGQRRGRFVAVLRRSR